MRRPEEALIVVHRAAPEGRVPRPRARARPPGVLARRGGRLEWGESAADAAARELLEETGLAAVPEPRRRYVYRLDDEPPEVRARYAPDVEEIRIHAFGAEAPAGWEPELDEEHVGYRWCSRADAVELLEYEEPRDAVREVARRLGVDAVKAGVDISPLVQTRAGTARVTSAVCSARCVT